MDPKMLKMLGKKKDNKMGDTEKEAKMNVVKEMRDMAASQMGEKLKGLKKVTVASDSKDGLEKGLQKAEDLLENSSEDGEEPSEENHDLMSQLENESDESEEDYADCSPEELDQKIKMLSELKQKKLKEQA